MSVSIKTKVNDQKWQEIIKEHKKIDKTEIKIGLFGSGQPDVNLAYRGAIHTFGIPKGIKVTDKMRGFLRYIGIFLKNTTKYIYIPKRPFMQESIIANSRLAKLMNFTIKQYALFIMDKLSPNRFLNRLGIFHNDQIKETITKGNFKKNHPATVKNKQSSRPLIDNGDMRNGVKYKIDKGI